jgi:hypothetical protein
MINEIRGQKLFDSNAAMLKKHMENLTTLAQSPGRPLASFEAQELTQLNKAETFITDAGVVLSKLKHNTNIVRETATLIEDSIAPLLQDLKDLASDAANPDSTAVDRVSAAKNLIVVAANLEQMLLTTSGNTQLSTAYNTPGKQIRVGLSTAETMTIIQDTINLTLLLGQATSSALSGVIIVDNDTVDTELNTLSTNITASKEAMQNFAAKLRMIEQDVLIPKTDALVEMISQKEEKVSVLTAVDFSSLLNQMEQSIQCYKTSSSLYDTLTKSQHDMLDGKARVVG